MYYRKSGVETNYSKATSDDNITALPREVATSLESGTKYDFIIETEVTNGSVIRSSYSDPVSATTELGAILATDASYVEYKATSAIDSTPQLVEKQLTYKDEVLYIKSDDTVKSYSSEKYPEVTKIITVLDQMGEFDKISINDKITELTLSAADATEAKIYDLTNVPSNAKVIVTGNATKVTSIKGNLTEITLDGENEVFNLSDLTAKVVNLSETGIKLTANEGTTLKFGSSAEKVTVNDVVLDGVSESGTVKVASDGFEFAGSALEEFTVDSSESTKVVNLKFSGATPETLNITADEKNGVKLSTNTILIKNLNVLNGKVDISNSPFANLKLGDEEATDTNKVILVTSNSDGSAINGKTVTTEDNPLLIEWLGYFTASAENNATVDYVANSKEISFTLKEHVTVTFAKLPEKLEVKSEGLKNKAPSEMQNKEAYEENMDAVTATVDSKTNTITVTVNKPMNEYEAGKNSNKKHAYYSLLVDVGIPRDDIKTGEGTYYIVTEDDIKNSASWGASDTEVIVWLEADTPEMILDFTNAKTGEKYYFTVKVVNYTKKSLD